MLTTVTGGDTIQLWLMTNGYAFSKSVICQFDVICEFDQELELKSPPPAPEKAESPEDQPKQKPVNASEDSY